MKHPFLKSILVLGSVLAFVNCSDDATNAVNNIDPHAYVPSEGDETAPSDPAWLLQAGGDLLIYPSGIVTDVNGTIAGTFVYNEGSTTGTIYAIDGSVVLENVNTNDLEIVTRETLSSGSSTITSSAAALLSSASAPIANSSSSIGGTTLSSAENTVQSSSSVQVDPPASSAAQTVVTDGNVTITGSLTQTVAKNGQTSEVSFSGVESYTRLSWNAWWLSEPVASGSTVTIGASTVPEYFEPENGNSVSEFFKINGQDYEFKITISGTAQQQTQSSSSQQQQTQSSSSQQTQSSSSAKSSSSAASSSSAKSSSSVASSSSVEVVTSGCPNITVKSGGASGSGFASRYWDGCKPSCSWSANAGSGNEARQCTANGKTELTDYNAQSVCDGGSAATCTSQIPFTVDGCTNIGFAFAAVPASNGGQCGKCFQLTFTGTGKYETKANQKALAGKKLIVMVTNIGADVNQGQFDILIPGGGVGLYNGTAGYGWGSQGVQYGGLLSECEKSVGYSGDLLTLRKQCLTEKCNESFASDDQAKQGCLFLADFMEAAGNPNHDYVEVECPSVLKSKY